MIEKRKRKEEGHQRLVGRKRKSNAQANDRRVLVRKEDLISMKI